MKYQTRITRLTVLPTGRPIFSEMATHVEIDDEAGGEFIRIGQQADGENDQAICIDGEEWPHIVEAVETMLKEIASPQKQ